MSIRVRYWKPGPLVFALMGLVAVFLIVAVDGVHPVPMSAVISGGVARQSIPAPRRCDRTQLAGLQQRVQLPAPPEGWPGTPQAVNVSNVFAGEVMIGHGDWQVCGRMHDARLHDARFGSGVGTLLIPPKGDHQPIVVAWATPLKPHWVPSVHLDDPMAVHEADILRLMVRVSCLAIALVLAFSALLGWIGTRNWMFALHLGICLLLLFWQALLSGLSGYPQPWIPVGWHEWAWLVALSAMGSAALLGGVLIQAGIGAKWPHWHALGRWLVWVFLGTAALSPWLPETALQQIAMMMDGLFAMSMVMVLILAVRSVRLGHPRARNIIIALVPLAVMTLAELFPCRFMLEYRVELIQLAITWCLSVMAWMLGHCYEQLRCQRDAMQQLADTDALTGLQNRRAGLARLEEAIASARESGLPLTVAFVDIDWFKRINDHYGHGVGDQVLVAVASTLTSCVRYQRDVVRMGGEEFLLLLPGTQMDMACRRMNTVRRRITGAGAALNIKGLSVSVSIGLAALDETDASSQMLLARADAAMYRAKHGGRDQVMAAVTSCASTCAASACGQARQALTLAPEFRMGNAQ